MSPITLYVFIEKNMGFGVSRFLNSLENKAGYTATEVTCRWAGAIFEVTRLFGRSSGVKKKIIKKSKM